jgi:hypothetical protein
MSARAVRLRVSFRLAEPRRPAARSHTRHTSPAPTRRPGASRYGQGAGQSEACRWHYVLPRGPPGARMCQAPLTPATYTCSSDVCVPQFHRRR